MATGGLESTTITNQLSISELDVDDSEVVSGSEPERSVLSNDSMSDRIESVYSTSATASNHDHDDSHDTPTADSQNSSGSGSSRVGPSNQMDSTAAARPAMAPASMAESTSSWGPAVPLARLKTSSGIGSSSCGPAWNKSTHVVHDEGSRPGRSKTKHKKNNTRHRSSSPHLWSPKASNFHALRLTVEKWNSSTVPSYKKPSDDAFENSSDSKSVNSFQRIVSQQAFQKNGNPPFNVVEWNSCTAPQWKPTFKFNQFANIIDNRRTPRLKKRYTGVKAQYKKPSKRYLKNREEVQLGHLRRQEYHKLDMKYNFNRKNRDSDECDGS